MFLLLLDSEENPEVRPYSSSALVLWRRHSRVSEVAAPITGTVLCSSLFDVCSYDMKRKRKHLKTEALSIIFLPLVVVFHHFLVVLKREHRSHRDCCVLF